MGQLDDGWYYVQGGRYTTKTFFTGLCELDGTWYYLENGVLDRSKNGVVPFNDEWWYITNGVWNNKASGLAEYENIWYYVKDGKIRPKLYRRNYTRRYNIFNRGWSLAALRCFPNNTKETRKRCLFIHLFIFIFSGSSIVVYYVLPGVWRRWVLLGSNLLFYLYGWLGKN